MMYKCAQEIISIIEKRKNRGHGLAHFMAFMDTIGNPQMQCKAIHVAGTNGKGSTTNDLRSILQAANYTTGSFTSPYMITHLDRIRVNDKNISEDAFVAIANQYFPLWMEWDLSMFEIDMCIACLYFVQEKVDISVFEVGLGGRLDATNILTPLVSVITNIGLDHMELLGDTIEKIAKEKAGIIKENTALITAESKESCRSIFKQICLHKHAPFLGIHAIKNIHKVHGHVCFDYAQFPAIELASGAMYQCANAALAIETIQYLRTNKDIKVEDAAIYEGLCNAVWIGRFEVVSHDPLILLDGAHNTQGIHALCASLQDIENPVIIFSALKDKNFHAMIKELQTISTTILVCQQKNERSIHMQEIQCEEGITCMEDVDKALSFAKAMHRAIVITGSLYFISEVRSKWFSNNEPNTRMGKC